MRSSGDAWDLAYRREGRVFPEPFQRFGELAEAFRAHNCHRLLDLGCGSGRHVVALARLGFEVLGLDYSGTALGLARDWLGEQGQLAGLVRGDMTRPLPFADASFDGILTTQVIHHALLNTIRGTIQELQRILRPGGLLFLTVPRRLEEGTAFEEIEPGTFVPLSGIDAGVPHHLFTAEDLQAELEDFHILELSARTPVVLALMGLKRASRTAGW